MDETSICNTALSFLGDKRIISLTDTGAIPELCRTYLPVARRQVLETLPWTFSRKRAVLSNKVDAPAFDWDYEAALPVDCLRVLQVRDKESGCDVLKFEVSSKALLSNTENTAILYVSDQEDYSTWSPSAVAALARLLASYLALPITGTLRLAESMRQIYEQVDIKQAQYLDVVQDQANENSQRVKIMRQSELRKQRFKGI